MDGNLLPETGDVFNWSLYSILIVCLMSLFSFLVVFRYWRLFPKMQVAYGVEIKKNGVIVADFYVPRLKYNVSFELATGTLINYFHILCPKMPVNLFVSFTNIRFSFYHSVG